MELLQRFVDKFIVDPETGCWLWTACKTSDGYGSFHSQGMMNAHKYAYTTLVGPVPEGTELDHTCRVRHCVNPAHLEPVTHRVNVQRGKAGYHSTGRCRKGHPYDWVTKSGINRCTTCWNEYMREYRQGKRRRSR